MLMKLDMSFLPSGDMAADAQQIQQAQDLGFDAAWSHEVAGNPFFALSIAAKTANRIQLGTQAAAFPRSPMVTAQIAWDLAKQSGGRFMLGLSAEMPNDIHRHCREEWTAPLERMREYIESVRAIWDTFQNGARLRYRGQHYQFRLMAPFFNPGAIEHPDIPIYLAAPHPKMCRLAGEICQGLHVPAFHTLPWLKDVILPEIERGLAAAGRQRSDFALTAPVFIAAGQTDERAIKAHIAFQAASQQALMAYHGWDGIHAKLRRLADEGKWAEMPAALPDEMLNEIALIAAPQEVAASIRQRYAGLADRICVAWQAGLMQTIAEERRQNRV